MVSASALTITPATDNTSIFGAFHGNGHDTPVIMPTLTTEVPQLPHGALLDESLGQHACTWLDNYVAYSRRWSSRSFDGFHDATALWVLSTVAARRVRFHFGKPRYTNLYLLLCGRTTVHAKSSATEIGRQLLDMAGLSFLLAPDGSTPQAFVKSMACQYVPQNYDDLDLSQQAEIRNRLAFNSCRGWYHEEFGSGVEAMLRPNGQMADYRGLLRALDDCPPTYSRETISRGIETINNPYLALVGNLTPSDLRPLAGRGSLLWGDGFLARFAAIVPPQKEILDGEFPEGERIIPDTLLKPLREWHERLGVPSVTVENDVDSDGENNGRKIVHVDHVHVKTLTVDRDVFDAVYAYDNALRTLIVSNENSDLDGNYGRLAEKSLRIAAMFASLSGCDSIQLPHLAKAQGIVERWRLYTHRLYEQVTESQQSEAAALEDNIMDAIKRWQGEGRYRDGLSAAEVASFVRGVSTGEASNILDGLCNAGALAKHKPARTAKYYIPGRGGL